MTAAIDLTPQLARRLRQMYAQGRTHREMAAEVGLAQSTVWRLLRRLDVPPRATAQAGIPHYYPEGFRQQYSNEPLMDKSVPRRCEGYAAMYCADGCPDFCTEADWHCHTCAGKDGCACWRAPGRKWRQAFEAWKAERLRASGRRGREPQMATSLKAQT